MRLKYILSAFASMAFAGANALTVGTLRVQNTVSPACVDETPRFSWVLSSSDRGVVQTAYRITITDADGTEVWDSGLRDSKESVDVPATGAILRPATRYFWKVSVKDNKGEEATSSGKDFFYTGLLSSGWGDAMWICSPYMDASTSAAVHYDLDFDLHLVKASAAIIFGGTSSSSYYMWQVNCNDGSNPIIRRHVYRNGNLTYSDTPFSSMTKSQILGHKVHFRIEVNGKIVKTYAAGKLVDTYTDSGNVPLGDLGMRVHNGTGEEGYFDNIVEKVYDASGKTSVKFSEDFSASPSAFLGAVIEDIDGSAACHMVATGGEKKVTQLSSEGVPEFRKTFTVKGDVKSAVLVTSGLGVYDVMVNSQRVTHPQADGTAVSEELKPGFTDIRKRVFYTTHDVTSLLRKGSNAIGAVAASGWYSGGIAHNIAGKDDNLGIIAKLIIRYSDGSEETIVSDTTWKTSRHGPLLYSDIYNGEIYDARLWRDISSSSYNDSSWDKAKRCTAFSGEIQAFCGPEVRALTDVEQSVKSSFVYSGTKATGTDYGMANVTANYTGPTAVTLKKGETVCFDFGQNIVGWPVFRVKGAAGIRLHFQPTEMLNDDGSVKRNNDGAGLTPYLANLRSARAEIYYTLAGDEGGEEWHPFTTFYGFRYLTVTSTGDVTIEKVTAMPVSSAHELTGEVKTSSTIVNQLISNILWGQRGNLLSAPTDCPQRDERQGWTADTQVFSQTGMYNANMKSFYSKWMQDMRNGQNSDGAFPDIAPQTGYAGYGGSAWSDAGIIVPWKIYLMYGDKQVIRDNYDSMEKYMNWIASQTGDGSYQGASTTYGDWLAYVATDNRYISMAYYAQDADLMARMSKAISTSITDKYAVKARKYATLYKNIRNAIQNRYFPSGSLSSPTQTSMLLALNFGLYKSDTQKKSLISDLAANLRTAGYVLNTGFLGTSILNQTLSANGLDDYAYNLILQRKNPSWLYPIDQGATTMWERWNSYTKESGFGNAGMNSFNHYAYGAVGEWIYGYMCGILPDEQNPGFRHFYLRPTPDERASRPDGQEQITEVNGHFNSPYGRIESHWKKADGSRFSYSCTVPAGTTATLYLPLQPDDTLAFTRGKIDTTGIAYKGYANGRAELSLVSGHYDFNAAAIVSAVKFHVSKNALSVTPVPCRDTITINSAEAPKDIRLFSSDGSQVLSAPDGARLINVSALSPGIYILKCKVGKKRSVTRIIKE